MLSIRLVQLIETHWEEIAARLINEVKKHPETQNLAHRPDAELRAWCRDIMENLEALWRLVKRTRYRGVFGSSAAGALKRTSRCMRRLCACSS